MQNFVFHFQGSWPCDQGCSYLNGSLGSSSYLRHGRGCYISHQDLDSIICHARDTEVLILVRYNPSNFISHVGWEVDIVWYSSSASPWKPCTHVFKAYKSVYRLGWNTVKRLYKFIEMWVKSRPYWNKVSEIAINIGESWQNSCKACAILDGTSIYMHNTICENWIKTDQTYNIESRFIVIVDHFI